MLSYIDRRKTKGVGVVEIIKLAEEKNIIDSLIEGVNLITGEIIPQTDIVKDEKIRESLIYLSEILDVVIENENKAIIKRQRARRKKFYIDQETRTRFEYSEEPISTAEFCRRLKKLVDREFMRGIEYGFFFKWLASLGLLSEPTKGGKFYYSIPTEKGEEIGVTIGKYKTRFGTKTIKLLSINAQKYLIDNLDDYFNFAKRRRLKV